MNKNDHLTRNASQDNKADQSRKIADGRMKSIEVNPNSQHITITSCSKSRYGMR